MTTRTKKKITLSEELVPPPRQHMYGCWYCPVTLCAPCFFGDPKHSDVCPRTFESNPKGGKKCENCGAVQT